MNKTIYMTYKKHVPEKIYSRWIKYNNEYKIDFSLDEDCIDFIETHFNKNVSNLFQSINQGMYKADLWRICKLYINGGVYADVDLVPYLNINNLDKNITFYTCLSINKNSIFQAFIANFSSHKNPLFLVFLISYLINKPYRVPNGPTYDMYNCLKYILNKDIIHPEEIYESDIVKIKICIGKSDKNIKVINLYYFPDDIEYNIKLHKSMNHDKFQFEITNNNLIVKRIDESYGWDFVHYIDICFKYNNRLFFFKEECNGHWSKSYVTHNNKKILDSRDNEYYVNKGW